jgi:hypothetical protein
MELSVGLTGIGGTNGDVEHELQSLQVKAASRTIRCPLNTVKSGYAASEPKLWIVFSRDGLNRETASLEITRRISNFWEASYVR